MTGNDASKPSRASQRYNVLTASMSSSSVGDVEMPETLTEEQAL